MKDLNKEIKIIKIIFRVISILVIVIGLFFSYLVAELDDAPGFIIIGTTFTLACALLLYGFGEIIISLKQNSLILSEINKKLKNKE